jgi:hypothetical protein
MDVYPFRLAIIEIERKKPPEFKPFGGFFTQTFFTELQT